MSDLEIWKFEVVGPLLYRKVYSLTKCLWPEVYNLWCSTALA